MKKMIRTTVSWGIKLLIAAFMATIIATVIQSSLTLSALEDMGLPVTSSIRLDTFFADFVGMGPSYGAIIFIAFAVGFIISLNLQKVIPISPHIAYPLAGACAIIVALWLMRYSFDITPISSARGTAGLALHAIAGVVGGRLFARLQTAHSDASTRAS